ncbi:vitelline membrane outer layer protein 1-like [Heteronotia binoei]|uniref:vitelline membrane outer layer protein 1-like n=1 Tax=Heteronotia binoei TaxID=13085 RepID=UPI00292F2BC5|nr:vitelline membrane outer layer protein 1-like [Heteronotia binoei]
MPPRKGLMFCLLLSLSGALEHPAKARRLLKEKQGISVSNGGPRGVWGRPEFCPEGTCANGFKLQVHSPANGTDKTGVNGIKLRCSDMSSITSTVGPWGAWTTTRLCPTGYLDSFALRTQQEAASPDKMAVTNVLFTCSSSSHPLVGDGLAEGLLGGWSNKCLHGHVICGIRTKVQNPQEQADETALNDALFYCCPCHSPPKPTPP